jgi:hypothetical protein
MTGIYPKILRQALHLTRSQKLFWKAGLFLVWPNLLRSLLAIGFAATWVEWGGTVAVGRQDVSEGNPWLGLACLLVMGLLLILYFRYKVVIVLAVRQLQDKPLVDRKKVYEEAEPHIASSLKFSLVSAVTIGIMISLLATPVLYLNSSGDEIQAGVLGVLAVLAGAPVLAVIYCAMVFGPMFMAAHYLNPWDGARASVDVFRWNWLFLAGLWATLLAVELAGLIVSVAMMLLAMLPFVLLMQIFYDVVGSAGWAILQALAGTAGFVVFFMSQAMVAAYQRVAWAVAFFEIVRPVKKEEAEEPETMPEVIS